MRVATESVVRYVPFIGSAFAAFISFGAMKLAGNAGVEDRYRTVRHRVSKASSLSEQIDDHEAGGGATIQVNTFT